MDFDVSCASEAEAAAQEDVDQIVERWIEWGKGRLPEIVAAYFLVGHGLIWLGLWLGLPVMLVPSWIGMRLLQLWLWVEGS